ALRDIAGSRERADHKTANPRAITKLCSLVRWLRRRKLPSFDVRRVHMVIPSTPTIPSYENGDSRPEPAFYDGIYLVDSPLHARGNISHRTLPWVWRMFVKLARS